jgi:hypothetical protein
VAGSDERLAAFFSDLAAHDPEWKRVYQSLDPAMPLRAAVAAFIEQLRSRVAPTPEEIRAADRLLATLEGNGFRTADQLLDEVDHRLARRRSRVAGS